MDLMRQVRVLMMNVVQRVMANRVSADGSNCQMMGLSGRPTPDVEILQGQGVHFMMPVKAEGIAVAPAGISDNAVIVGMGDRKTLPTDSCEPGEGGLHYLGEFKVFLAADGTVSLGATEAADFVALASKVDAAISLLQTAIGAGFTAVGVGVAANGPAGKTAFESAAAALLPTGSLIVKAD